MSTGHNVRNRLASAMPEDRYSLAAEFALQRFEMDVMRCDDLYELQVLAIKLYAQTQAQRRTYEAMLRDSLPKM